MSRADIFGPTAPLVGVADLVEGALFRFRIATTHPEGANGSRFKRELLRSSSENVIAVARPERQELIQYKGAFRRNLLNSNYKTEFCGLAKQQSRGMGPLQVEPTRGAPVVGQNDAIPS